MSLVRRPAVADRFYPGNAAALSRMLDDFMADAKPARQSPKALIVPHAGYLYSGSIAASAYATLADARDSITKVVLLGPSHRVPLRGLATSHADAFETPLGRVMLDRAAIEVALTHPAVRTMEEAHAFEHSLEVQLPFLQKGLSDFSLVPFVVGDANPEDVAAVLDLLWGGEETLIVTSSDLSHYLSYDRAKELDTATSRAIETLRPQDIGEQQACGRIPVKGLLEAARRHGLRAETLDLRNSGETAGPRDQVVGYGAYGFY
ncbi:AmmeMemoRadiSam system protein B [Thiorhodococcus mannitoliphagus]|uniref:MEMO1 family protein G3480_09970 n=1 Tax=Thiorhodococcus mannitoliphagus TaxID=329406 RepID=A0A6P1DUI3_9GAMM|nr:AmmeMemoRadiSam system protein B [Thiorhodococcus mannitoliphagus]NEX20631.1 AmmeMemoRadiSam system protein B [Thiorhodococcus mannitoliphagus]